MSFFSFLTGNRKDKDTTPPTAKVAKDRLQLILINERGSSDSVSPDYLPKLQQELIEVISRYVQIDSKDIQVQLDRQEALEVLEVKIELPQLEAEKNSK